MKKNNKKGFTLVELVIVVAVMAILVAVAIPTISSITDSATTAVNKSNARAIESIIKLYEAEVDAGTAESGATLQKAMEDAKLGIESGTFYYNKDTGECTFGGTAPTNNVKIEYSAGVPTVTGTLS